MAQFIEFDDVNSGKKVAINPETVSHVVSMLPGKDADGKAESHSSMITLLNGVEVTVGGAFKDVLNALRGQP